MDIEKIRWPPYPRCDVLILVGSNSSFVKQTEAMHKQSNLEKTSLIKLENVGDVLIESPEKVYEALLFFYQVYKYLNIRDEMLSNFHL